MLTLALTLEEIRASILDKFSLSFHKTNEALIVKTSIEILSSVLDIFTSPVGIPASSFLRISLIELSALIEAA